MYRPPLLFASLLAAASPCAGQCPPLGITLTSHGGRFGDAWGIDLQGPPSTPGLLGFDFQPGPSPTPIGTICLGMTPNLALQAFVTQATGLYGTGGVMPVLPPLVGQPLFLAAVALDPTRASGFAISNGRVLVPQQPRLWFVDAGVSTPFGSRPGSAAALDVLTNTPGPAMALPAPVRDATFADGLVALLANGTVAGFDDAAGSPTFQLTLAGAAAQASRVLLLRDHGWLSLLSPGTPPGPFSGGTPGSVETRALPLGSLIGSVTLPAGNPDAMLQVPHTTLLLLRLATAVVPIDVATSTAHPPIPLPAGMGTLVDWQLSGNVLYCLHSGRAATPFSSGQPAALSAIDVTAQVPLFTQQLAMPAPVELLRAGPGSTGPSLFVYGSAAGTLEEFAQGSGQPTGSLPVGSGIVAMEPSSLGSEWLLLCDGPACGGPLLWSLAVGGSVLLPVLTLPAPPQHLIAVLRSDTFGRCGVVTGIGAVQTAVTDPHGSASSTATVALAGPAFQVFSN